MGTYNILPYKSDHSLLTTFQVLEFVKFKVAIAEVYKTNVLILGHSFFQLNTSARSFRLCGHPFDKHVLVSICVHDVSMPGDILQ